MYLIDTFDAEALVSCRDALRGLMDGAISMEDVAQRTVRHLYERFTSASGEPACALVRFYKTHRFGMLPDEQQRFAGNRAGGDIDAATSCLTLLATAGTAPAWNDPSHSIDHWVIPLVGEDLEEAPMISALIHEMGIDERLVLRPTAPVKVDTHLRQYNVFYVAEAAGSPAVPAQDDFVLHHGIRSVVGFGGVLASGDVFAVILFTVVPVQEAALPSFRTLALTVKTAILPFTFNVFGP